MSPLKHGKIPKPKYKNKIKDDHDSEYEKSVISEFPMDERMKK
jgi:hypothetical protein